MNPVTKLEHHLVNPVINFVGQEVEKVLFTDVFPHELISNDAGIYIVAQQIIIQFKNEKQLYFSWNTIKGWAQYVLVASSESFVIPEAEKEGTFQATWDDLEGVINKRLTGFSILGYVEYSGTFSNQPHLILLKFEGKEVAIANFHQESDFTPKYPTGDDIWVIFDTQKVHEFITTLELKELYTYEL